MTQLWKLMIVLFLIPLPSRAKVANPVKITGDGWSVSVDLDHSTLTIATDKLGAVLQDVHLNLQKESRLIPLQNWAIEKKSPRQLYIRTEGPRTGWIFTVRPDLLKVSSTSAEAVLTGEAPAPPARIIARLIDREGVPVTWEGTPEVAGNYGGKQTRNRSFLPMHNAETMYFGLGQVSSLKLHSLFDRKTDVAIQFSDETRMRRNRQNPDLLDITIPVPVNTVVRVFPDYYTRELGLPYYVPYNDSYFRRAPVVWNSWAIYFDHVTEKNIVENTDWIARNLKAYGFQYIVLDDGYDRGENGVHDWIENWNKQKFPHGPQWLANYIRSKGLQPGVWLVPNTYGGAVKKHPDWYLHYKNGTFPLDYNTPLLDSTNPEVLDFLKHEFTILDNWGFQYYKFDGEFAAPEYVPDIDRNKLYNKSIDSLVAYRNRLKVIRETIGPKRFIEACPSGTPLNGIGYFNSYFNGQDMYPSWQGSYFMFGSVSANAFFNHIVAYTMPGEGINLTPRTSVEEAGETNPEALEAIRGRERPLMGFGVTSAEARTMVSYLSLTGVVYSVSSIMPELPPGRIKLLKMTLPPMPILPIDLFSRGSDTKFKFFRHTTAEDYIHNFPRILDLKVNAKSGIYDVVALTNWRNDPITRDLSFARQLGLDPTASYVAFDFWNQKLCGVFKSRMEVAVDPHDTRVFLIHRSLNRPQLIGTSRHITGAYSILGLTWDASTRILSGRSQARPGEDYTLSIYVPKEEMISRIEARTAHSQKVPLSDELKGNSLKVVFQGQPDPVNWKITFTSRPRY